VFGAVVGQPWKMGGLHEALFCDEVTSSKQNESIDQGSDGVIYIAAQHRFMQLIQTIHDGLMLLVHLFDTYRVSAFPTE
jgi:hypothetical protein